VVVPDPGMRARPSIVNATSAPWVVLLCPWTACSSPQLSHSHALWCASPLRNGGTALGQTPPALSSLWRHPPLCPGIFRSTQTGNSRGSFGVYCGEFLQAGCGRSPVRLRATASMNFVGDISPEVNLAWFFGGIVTRCIYDAESKAMRRSYLCLGESAEH